METGLTKNQMIAELVRSPHGKLEEYAPVVKTAAKTEPEFLAHLISWNQIKGQIRDAKLALPLFSLTEKSFPDDLAENSLAHLALQGPREFLRAYRFALSNRIPGRMSALERLLRAYLHEREADNHAWDRVAVQHRSTLKELYALGNVKPGSDYKNIVLFGRRLDKKTRAPLPHGSVFEVIAGLKDMPAVQAAAEIQKRHIPFLIAKGALGKNAKDPDLVLALINQMSASELVNNTKMLEGLGMKSNPALRGAFQAGLQKAASSTKNVLKATRAAEAVDDEELKENLRGLQEKQLQSMSVEGDWLVLADKSGSMASAIEAARHIAATLAKMVSGKVWLVFFDTHPMTVDVTGLPLDAIKKATEHVRANGGTSIGCGLQRMLDEKVHVDGIVVVSDGGENSPPVFAEVYPRYAKLVDKQVPVYLYHCGSKTGEFSAFMRQAHIDLQVFDLPHNIDYYSLPNLVQTMRTNRYSILDEVMSTRLLTLKDVFKAVPHDVREKALA